MGVAALVLSIGQMSPALSQSDIHGETDDWAAAMVGAINRYRAQRGLEPWPADERLMNLAGAHGQRMAAQARMFHAGMAEQAQREGWFHCVENLATADAGAERVVALWRASEAHHLNLIDPAPRRVGLGVSGRYVAMLACTPGPAQWRRLAGPESPATPSAASAPEHAPAR